MSESFPAAAKDDLHRYLQTARDVMLWKLDGLGEHDVRRPLTPTGTNLLGLVKHLALVEVGYFSVPFGRPVGLSHPWVSEGREDAAAGSRGAWAQADAAIGELPIDAVGRVPWWGPAGGREVTLHRVVVHV